MKTFVNEIVSFLNQKEKINLVIKNDSDYDVELTVKGENFLEEITLHKGDTYTTKPEQEGKLILGKEKQMRDMAGQLLTSYGKPIMHKLPDVAKFNVKIKNLDPKNIIEQIEDIIAKKDDTFYIRSLLLECEKIATDKEAQTPKNRCVEQMSPSN